MLRALARLIGLALLALGFAALVVDGARAVAGAPFALAPLGALAGAALGPDGGAPGAWAAARVPGWAVLRPPLAALPAAPALMGAGLLLLALGRRRAAALDAL